MMTCEPGDLPKHVECPRAGCPVSLCIGPLLQFRRKAPSITMIGVFIMGLSFCQNRSGIRRDVDASTAPEDVFMRWLLSRPQGSDIAEAARREVARLESPASQHEGARRLHELFRALIEAERPVRA